MIGHSAFDICLYWLMIGAVMSGIAKFIAGRWGD